jgi:hypothetical protein
MHKQRIAMLIGGVICLAGIWLPWVHFKTGLSAKGIQVAEGRYALALLVPMVVLSLAGDLRTSWSGRTLALAIVPSLATAMLGILQISSILTLRGEGVLRRTLSEKVLEGAEVGFGLWLVTVGGLLVPVLTFALQRDRPSRPAEQNGIQGGISNN